MNLAKRLLEEHLLTPEQLDKALHRQKKYGGFLADHVVALGLLDPKTLAAVVPSYPKAPQTFEEVGLPKGFLVNLLIKHAFFRYSFSSREMSESLKLPEHLIEILIEYLQQQKYLDISPRDLLRPSPGHLATEMRFTLTESGKGNAAQLLEFCNYVGPAPVTLEDYWDWVEAQTIQKVKITDARLREAFKDYVVPESLLNEIRPAVASGRSIFLFGPSGNGKTALAGCLGEIFEDAVYVPYALYIQGQIMRVYDEDVHEAVTAAEVIQHDSRWVLSRRPVVIAGGEMTEAALEPKYNAVAKYYEAPHQVQANNGLFIIDDFGRQKISPQKLLNRWMVPLESRKDFCSLHTGQQFAVPFDQLVIFCTNLDPYALADEAFLRRIRHKVFIGEVSLEQYLEIFRRVCEQYGLSFDRDIILKMVEYYYAPVGRPFRACHPRDLVENLLDDARSLGQEPQLTCRHLDAACRSYLIKSRGITDYDKLNRGRKPLAESQIEGTV